MKTTQDNHKAQIDVKFLDGIKNWCNHRPLLYKALKATDGLVCEMGCGHGSTPFLYEYCKIYSREFISLESDKDWARKYSSIYVANWEQYEHTDYDVLLVDHAPGERRHIDIMKLANSAKIIVIHDSEPEATGYMLDTIWHLFKFRCDLKTNRAWATAVSNIYDVSKWSGECVANYTLS